MTWRQAAPNRKGRAAYFQTVRRDCLEGTMRISRDDAIIALNEVEVDDFRRGGKMFDEVIAKANRLSDTTDRTVSIWSPTAELGFYDAEEGEYRPA